MIIWRGWTWYKLLKHIPRPWFTSKFSPLSPSCLYGCCTTTRARLEPFSSCEWATELFGYLCKQHVKSWWSRWKKFRWAKALIVFLETRLIGDQLLEQVKDMNIVFQLCVNTTIKSIIWQVCTSVAKPDLFCMSLNSRKLSCGMRLWKENSIRLIYYLLLNILLKYICKMLSQTKHTRRKIYEIVKMSGAGSYHSWHLSSGFVRAEKIETSVLCLRKSSLES